MKDIEIAGYKVKQLTEKTYEGNNEAEQIDFHITIAKSNEIEVFIFDSNIPTDGDEDPFLEVYTATSLEEAVEYAMTWCRD